MSTTHLAEAPALDLYGADYQRDPHGALRAAREAGWCAPTPIGTAVLRYDEVQALLADPAFRTPGAALLAMQGITDGILVETMSGFLLNSHGEAHARVRRLVGKAFTARSVDQFRPRMREIARECVDGMRDAGGECDFVAAFADPYAFRVLCEFVGIPASGREDVHAWVGDIALMFGLSVREHQARIEASLTSLYGYIDELAASVRARPAGDLLSALVAAEERGDLLTDAELRWMVVTLLSAGSDTATHQWGNALVTFMAHPDAWRELAADPALAPAAAEEVIRYAPSVILGVPRIATEPRAIRDRTFAPGDCVLPITASANRDGAVFEDPDRFDIHRPRKGHLTFGGGVHYCLGVSLARAEFQEALPELARRVVDPQPAGEAAWRLPTEAVYGPTRLPVRCRVGAA